MRFKPLGTSVTHSREKACSSDEVHKVRVTMSYMTMMKVYVPETTARATYIAERHSTSHTIDEILDLVSRAIPNLQLQVRSTGSFAILLASINGRMCDS